MHEGIRKIHKEIIKSILAGFCIGMGGSIYLSLDNSITGAFLFSVGLLCVCAGKLNLFTGKVCYLKFKDPDNYLFLLQTLVGNLAGTGILAFLLLLTRNAEKLTKKAAAICETKAGNSFLSLFVLGMLCNVFIFIAVHGYRNIKHEAGKYLAIIFGVMGFILSGTEHCVADMFYIGIAGAWSPDMVLRLSVIVAGNACGGILAYRLFEAGKERD